MIIFLARGFLIVCGTSGSCLPEKMYSQRPAGRHAACNDDHPHFSTVAWSAVKGSWDIMGNTHAPHSASGVRTSDVEVNLLQKRQYSADSQVRSVASTTRAISTVFTVAQTAEKTPAAINVDMPSFIRLPIWRLYMSETGYTANTRSTKAPYAISRAASDKSSPSS